MATVEPATKPYPKIGCREKNGNDFRDDPKCRKDHDVDLGMSEIPEDVLPEDGRTAAGRIEKATMQVAVNQQHKEGRVECRKRQNDQKAVDRRHPGEER